MSQEIETLHQPFAKYLRSIPLPYTYHDPTRPTTSTLGDADFIIYRGVLCLHIEFKTKEGKPSKSQIERHKELAAAGTRVYICRKLEPAIELVQKMIAVGGGVTQWREGNIVNGAADVGSIPTTSAPKEYLASARYVGDVVVAKNLEGHVGFVRKARDTDAGLPRWTEALGW